MPTTILSILPYFALFVCPFLEQEASGFLSGEIEVDESYFGGRRKGKRGLGAGGKVPVFVL